MLKTAKQFEPDQQIDSALGDFDEAIRTAQNVVGRMEWLKLQLVKEVEQLRRERDQLEVYNESEAAALLRVETKHLADMRRRHDLPHCGFGTKVRYTKEQLLEICSLFAVNTKGRLKLRKAA